MIVLGADMHKSAHTIAAVKAGTGEVLGEKTVAVGARGFAGLLDWARDLERDRVWALEDCRHVSGAMERFLIARGERVLRVAPRLTAESRRSSRERGKSDRIDAIAVARAALGEGLETLPAAQLAGVELDIRLLVDHRERLVHQRVALNNDLRWHLHDLWPEIALPGLALFSRKWSTRMARRLSRGEQTARVRIARDELRRLRELTYAIDALEAEIAELVAHVAPQLLAEPGVRPLTAAKLVGEIAGAERFATDAKLARAAPRTDPGQLRALKPPPPRSRRQPPDQRRHPPHRRHSQPRPRRDHRLRRTQAGRGQDQTRSDPQPQAPPRPPHLAPTPAAPPAQEHRHTINFLTEEQQKRQLVMSATRYRVCLKARLSP